jgi:uridine phosphorylase
METSAIYGLAKLLGHNACSISAIMANRANGTFSKSPDKLMANLISYTLEKLVKI